MRIIHPYNSGIAILCPCGDTLTIEEIAVKDVPAGVPYLIIPDDMLPTDREFRAAWEADFSNPDGYGIGHEA